MVILGTRGSLAARFREKSALKACKCVRERNASDTHEKLCRQLLLCSSMPETIRTDNLVSIIERVHKCERFFHSDMLSAGISTSGMSGNRGIRYREVKVAVGCTVIVHCNEQNRADTASTSGKLNSFHLFRRPRYNEKCKFRET